MPSRVIPGRGGTAREPGTYEHRPAKGGRGPWSWVPGPRAVPE